MAELLIKTSGFSKKFKEYLHTLWKDFSFKDDIAIHVDMGSKKEVIMLPPVKRSRKHRAYRLYVTIPEDGYPYKNKFLMSACKLDDVAAKFADATFTVDYAEITFSTANELALFTVAKNMYYILRKNGRAIDGRASSGYMHTYAKKILDEYTG